MKKLSKSRSSKGFTLIEMVLVIAIIVILAAVMVFNISGYLGRAKNAASSLKSHNSSISKATSEIDAQTNS
ncbi:MAG: type II secretion system GspH family protein [Saccharofermentans sp.]|nr:type II secretion system GspH family protein [Saccharofermentans sp.]